MNKVLSLSLIAIIVNGCSFLWEYRSIYELENMTWKKSEPISFDIELDSGSPYDCIIIIRHTTGFHLKQIPINLTISDSTLSYSSEVVIPILSDEGEYLGEGSVDLWDVEFAAMDSLNLPKGNYKAELSQLTHLDEIQLIMEVGIMIKRAK